MGATWCIDNNILSLQRPRALHAHTVKSYTRTNEGIDRITVLRSLRLSLSHLPRPRRRRRLNKERRAGYLEIFIMHGRVRHRSEREKEPMNGGSNGGFRWGKGEPERHWARSWCTNVPPTEACKVRRRNDILEDRDGENAWKRRCRKNGLAKGPGEWEMARQRLGHFYLSLRFCDIFSFFFSSSFLYHACL